jgi:hypothetical protein
VYGRKLKIEIDYEIHIRAYLEKVSNRHSELV